MSSTELLRAADRRTTPWKNGGGLTGEVAISPGGAGFDFGWRLSIASVAEEGAFSRFEDVERVLAVLHGRLTLSFVDRIVDLQAGDPPYRFAGDTPVIGRPVQGPTLDLNLMTRRSRFNGTIVPLAPAAERTLRLSARTAILLFVGEGIIEQDRCTTQMGPLDALRIDDAAGERIGIASTGVVYLVSIDSLPG